MATDELRCQLVQTVAGLQSLDECSVSEEACRTCGQWYPPNVGHLNPVVASILYSVCGRIISNGGQPDCSVDHAAAIQQQAMASIPHDFDSIPLAEQVDDQPNVALPDVGHLIPRPRHRYGRQVRRWAVAVTTAPRSQMTLDRCLSSIVAAGWADIRIMIDGEVDISEEWRDFPSTQRTPSAGAWPSYYLTLVELLMRSPDADAFMVVQDDVVLFRHPNLREYLESVLWPHPEEGIVSLFCSRAYSSEDYGWHIMKERLQWGGQALIFSRRTLIKLLADPMIVEHRLAADNAGLANIDGLIGAWAEDTGTPVSNTSPSLSQHIGHISSLWVHSRAFINRSAACFAGNAPPR